MSNLPNSTKITGDMLKNDPDQAAQLINNFISDVVRIFDKGISIQEQLAGQVNEITIYISDSQKPYPFSFRWNQALPPRACWLVRARCTDNTLQVMSAPFPDWDFVNGQIIIKSLVGNFTVNKSYILRFVTLA